MWGADLRRSRNYLSAGVGLLLGALLLTAPQALAAAPEAPASPPVQQIVAGMLEANQHRAHDLLHYTEQRHYQVEYHGFPAHLEASMDVEATFDAPSTKSFRILSQTGAKLLVDHVLKQLLESEKEAALDPARTALSPDNYSFTLVDTEPGAAGPTYVLSVEPRADSKFLYRGRIWVDGKDLAVTRIEAEPAKNPSFWIRSTSIHHVYTQTGEFWLPQHNRSETKVRTGGTAVLTIDYGPYQINSAAK